MDKKYPGLAPLLIVPTVSRELLEGFAQTEPAAQSRPTVAIELTSSATGGSV